MSTLAEFIDLNADEQGSRGLLFTPREIAQQPDTWGSTLRIFRENQSRICAFLEKAGVQRALQDRPVVLLVGAGTSDHIGQALVLLLQEMWGCVVLACASTDLLLYMDQYVIPGRDYLHISFSRSGDSPEGVAVLEEAIRRFPTMAHMIVTCNADARMIATSARAELSCVVVLDDAVNDRSLAMTSSFTNLVLLGQCLAHAWRIDEYVPIHGRLLACGQEMLTAAARAAESIADRGIERACFVGSGPLAAVAKESALKLLELTAGQVRTMSETVLGLRHGPMAALDEGTLLVCFVPEDGRKALYARDLLEEIGSKQIASYRIAIGPGSARAELASVCDVYLPVADNIPDTYRPVIDVLFGQLLGLYCSVARGLKPDSPSPSGVISRVVRPFQIY